MKPLPTWVKAAPPNTASYHYYVGEAHGALAADEAHARAWASALWRAGISEFPQAVTMQGQAREALSGSHFEMQMRFLLPAATWIGVSEVVDKESPALVSEGDKFGAYRLLRWDVRELAKLHQRRWAGRLSSTAKRGRVEERKFQSFFQQIPCGELVESLVPFLGYPESILENPLRYRWSSFEVLPHPDSGAVWHVASWRGKWFYVCPCLKPAR